MLTTLTDISSIQINDSMFSLRSYIFESREVSSCYLQTFDTLGIIHPITLYEDPAGRLHLIDGIKRIQFARQNGIHAIEATILPSDTALQEIILLIMCNKRHEIELSTINKIQFLYFAVSLNIPSEWITNSICMPFSFKPHQDFLTECERIYTLPVELKLFCHAKNFSLKQLLNLSRYPVELLNMTLKWQTALQLSASVFIELASGVRDYMRAGQHSLQAFLDEPDVNELLESSMAPKDKTECFRRLLQIKRYPILTDVQTRINDRISNMDLPKEVCINWDQTLENKKLDIKISIQNGAEWRKAIASLNSDQAEDYLREILNEL
ncbi:hypothetical protein H8E50_01915 [bacterium]|nr:hypothetical protein [bacterium]